MRRAFLASAVVAGALLAAACSDQQSPLSTEPQVSPSLSAPACPRPLELAVLIVALFPPNELLTFAAQMHSDINLKMSKGDRAGAQKVVLAFIDFTVKTYYAGKLRDPTRIQPPITQKDAVINLINGLLCWVGLPPSGLELLPRGADVAVTTKVIGRGGDKFTSTDHLSGLQVPRDAVSEDRLWVITERHDLAKAGTCVSTTLRSQIPLCVDFAVVPVQDVAVPLVIAICQPEDNQPVNRRLAHKLLDGKVELLAAHADPFPLVCTSTPDFPPPGLGRVGRAVWKVGSLMAQVLGPKRLHAGHSGLGGLLGPKLSPVTAVQVRLTFEVQPSSTEAGRPISPAVQVAFRDSGTGALATEITNRIQVAIGSDPNEGGSTLAGTTTQTPTGGVATFADLSINRTGVGFTLVSDALSSSFTGDSLIHIPGTSNTFDILSSAVLYGVNSADDGLSTYNVATGAATFIGNLNASPDSFTTPVAMAARPSDGGLFVWNNSPQAFLLTVDVCTGLASHVANPAPNPGALSALAFSPGGTLYGLDTDLRQVDPTTGGQTLVGSFGTQRVGGADFIGSTLYGITFGGLLVTVNTSSGALTTVGAMSPNPGTPGSIVYDAATDKLVGSAFGGQLGNVIFDINRTNATITNIRTVTGGFAPQGMGFAPACTRSP